MERKEAATAQRPLCYLRYRLLPHEHKRRFIRTRNAQTLTFNTGYNSWKFHARTRIDLKPELTSRIYAKTPTSTIGVYYDGVRISTTHIYYSLLFKRLSRDWISLIVSENASWKYLYVVVILFVLVAITSTKIVGTASI